MPTQRSSFVACEAAYASDHRDMDEKGNGYHWESLEKEGERSKGQIGITVTIFRNLGSENCL